MVLRLSHSQLDLFKSCPRNYYHKYVMKDEEKDVEYKYMNFGSACHEVLELYYSGKITDVNSTMNDVWSKYKLEGRMDFNKFKLCVLNGIQQKLDPTHTELCIRLKIGGYDFIGYLDVVDTNKKIVIDYKTGAYSKDKENKYKEQLLCYSYLYFRQFGEMTTSLSLFFVEGNKRISFSFTADDLINYEKYVIETAQKIEQFIAGNNKELWLQNFGSCNWCAYKYICFNNKPTQNITLLIQNNYCFLQGDADELLLEGIDRELKFDLKNKYFMQQAIVQRNGGKRPENYDDIGTTHLFNKRIKMFSIGSLEKVKKIIRDYCEYKGKLPNITIDDKRNPDVMNKKLGIMPPKLIGDKELRDYQIEAVDKFTKNKMGYLEVATGGGKTIITAEIIRQLDTPTLFIIDRKELLRQTRAVFQEVLGIPIGIIGDGEHDIQNVTVATIQSLSRDVNKYKDFLHKINLVIVDEGHHGSSSSYVAVLRECRNAGYRLATTGTAIRDDKMEPVMFSLLGDIIYQMDARTLMEKGYLMEPKIIFVQTEYPKISGPTYSDVYEDAIVNNEERNNEIINIIQDHPEDRILVLTTRIEHGEILRTTLVEKGINGVYFLHGSVNKDERKAEFEKFKTNDMRILIGTVSIFSEGIDLPFLSIIINACANKAEVRTIQSLGRILRTMKGKQQPIYYDFIDNADFLDKASRARMRTFKRQGYIVKIKGEE